MRRTVTLFLIAMLAFTPAARADDIADALREALRAYEAGRLPAARTALEEALQLLAQRGAATLAEALPGPLPGWTAEEAQSSAGGAGLFGGTQASRSYRNAQGQSVEITITTDNPIIAQLAMVLTNPMLAGAMGRLVRIGEQRAVQMNDGEIQMLVDNRVLVSLRGDAPAEAKLVYARAVDQARLTRR